MSNRINYLPLIISVIVVNAAGFLLRFYEFDSYLIFLGFRFHISFILPFIFCSFFKINFNFKDIFSLGRMKDWWIFLFTLIAFNLVLFTGYFIFKLEPGDPEYFYEFGLSSIVDFPVYFLWNFPQMAALFVVVNYFGNEKKVFLKSFLIMVLLFLFEFIPVKKEIINPISLVSFLIMVTIASTIISRHKSVYIFALILFSTLWINLLAIGSTSEILVNHLFARQYSYWEGFFVLDKKISDYVLAAQLFFTFVLLLLHAIFRARPK